MKANSAGKDLGERIKARAEFRRNHGWAHRVRRFLARFLPDLAWRHSHSRDDLRVGMISILYRGLPNSHDILQRWAVRELAPIFNRGLVGAFIVTSTSVSEDVKHYILNTNTRFGPERWADVPNEGQSRRKTEEMRAEGLQFNWAVVLYSVVRATEDEFERLVVKLTTECAELFNEYDRLKAEAELRLSLVLPLISLVVIGMVQWAPIVILGMAAPVVLLVQGARRQHQARTQVWLALDTGKVNSPTMDEIKGVSLEHVSEPRSYFLWSEAKPAYDEIRRLGEKDNG